MPSKKNNWEKENPIVQELFKQVKVKLNCSEEEKLDRGDIIMLSQKTPLSKRTLNEYFGLTKARSSYCLISNLNALAKFIGKRDFDAFILEEREKQERVSVIPQSFKTTIEAAELSSNLATGKAALNKVIKKLINAVDFKNDIYQILINIYPQLQKNTNPESKIDFFTYDAEGKNIEFVFTILNFNYAPFDKRQLDQCRQAIEQIKKLTEPVFSFVLICNTLTNTPEYKTILNKTAELQDTGKAEIARFYDIRSFLINEIAENIDIEIRNRILESNQKFKDQFQKQMDQHFYVEEIPFSIDADSKKRSNPVRYLAESSIRQKNKYSEIEYSLRKQFSSGLDTEKGWNFIVSEFGFGKTSLLLNLFKKLNQTNILSIFLPLSFFKDRLLYTTSDISRIILEILFDERKFDYHRNFDRLMAGTLDNMLERRCDLILLFDGLDEHQAAYTPQGLQNIFRGTAKLSAECFFTLRKEFWDDRQGNFRDALEPIRKERQFYFLLEWSDIEILRFIDEYVEKSEIKKEEVERIKEFRELVLHKNYDQFYGDIPRRPLFLKMLIVDIVNNRIRKRSLAEIYEEYLIEKFKIDRTSQFSRNIRSPLQMEKTEDRDKVLSRIFHILEKTAALMFFVTKENECILMPSVNENKIEEIKFLKEKEFRVTEILMNSILVPYGKRDTDGFYLKFAHKSFQEYFFARAIYTTLTESDNLDNLIRILKSKHSDGVVTFLKGIIDSKRRKKAEFNYCVLILSKMKVEDLSPDSLLFFLISHLADDIKDINL